MVINVMDRRMMIGRKQLLSCLGLIVGWLTLVSAEFAPLTALVLLGIIYLVLRFMTQPLSRIVARFRYSIRWKFELAVVAIAGLFLVVSLIQIGAMNFMHGELHGIQDMGHAGPFEVLNAVNELEDTHHGALYRLLPVLSVLGVLGAAAIGAAMAWSVINPVSRMKQAMDRIASGDFSQPLYVENRDELGELANRINDTAGDLARLQEATLAEERARGLRERIIQVTTAQEEERRRISRDLHDGLGPSLAAVGNRLRACQNLVRTEPERAEKELEEMARGLRGHVQEVRQLIHDLRPLALDQLGLAKAVEQQVSQFDQQTGIRASFTISGDVVLNSFADVTVFRVVQECLTNVRKHANATQVDVRIKVSDTGVETMVKDNGKGFDARGVASDAVGKSMGLLNMRERSELLGGNFSVQSSPNRGSKIILFIPTTGV